MEKKYLEIPEYREKLKGLISATDYARVPPYQCLNCLPYCGEVRAAFSDEYKKVIKALNKLKVTREEVNQELEDKHWHKLFGEHECFEECLSPNDLCEIVASIINKKELLLKTKSSA
ncbi:MAG: hypothetical protein WC781_01645 [Candidatus Pacearchaeota archaeon]|jgi:hypothetical protein